MAEDDDRRVAGRPGDPQPDPAGSPREASAQDPSVPAAGAAPDPDPETKESGREDPAVAAHRSPPPPGAGAPPPPLPPPPGGPAAPPPGPVSQRMRGWAGSRPLQLVAAGVIGAIIGGGLVATLDILDDGHDRGGYHRYDRMGGGPGLDREGPGMWHRHYYGDQPPMMPYGPGGPGGDQWRRMPMPLQPPTTAPAPSATPSPGS